MSTRKMVVFTTCSKLAPAAARTARRLASTCSVCGLHAFDHLARFGFEADLAGGEDEVACADGLAVRANGGRRRRGVNDLSHGIPPEMELCA